MGFLRANWIRVMGFAFAAAMILAAGACGSSNSGDTVRPTPDEGTTQGDGVVLETSAREWSFVPDRLQFAAGEQAELVMHNDGNTEHSIAVYEDDEYETPLPGAEAQPAPPGESRSVSLQSPEEGNALYFRCEIHTDMVGTIEIGPAGTARR